MNIRLAQATFREYRLIPTGLPAAALAGRFEQPVRHPSGIRLQIPRLHVLTTVSSRPLRIVELCYLVASYLNPIASLFE